MLKKYLEGWKITVELWNSRLDIVDCSKVPVWHYTCKARVTPRGLPQAVFSNRRSRPYSVAGRSSYLTAGSYTMYRRAHSYRQAASS